MPSHADDVQRYLDDAEYPTEGAHLARLVEARGGPDELVRALQGLHRVDGPDAVLAWIKQELPGPGSPRY